MGKRVSERGWDGMGVHFTIANMLVKPAGIDRIDWRDIFCVFGAVKKLTYPLNVVTYYLALAYFPSF